MTTSTRVLRDKYNMGLEEQIQKLFYSWEQDPNNEYDIVFEQFSTSSVPNNNPQNEMFYFVRFSKTPL